MMLTTIPRATLRLQFNKEFTLEHTLPLIPYFAKLGVSHLYASPLLTARPGSMHGYDVMDPGSINPELGGLPALRRLVAALRAEHMGLLLDIVPNHMGVGTGNAWWQDVLEFGEKSRYAAFFDIDWQTAAPSLRGKILAPFLEAPYGEVLSARTIKLRLDQEKGGFHFSYYENEFPLSPASTSVVLGEIPGGGELAEAFARAAAQADPAAAVLSAKQEMRRFAAQAVAIQPVLDALSAPERLGELLDQQHYRLAWWRTAGDEINWRRFFDINTLAGLRAERPEVFEASHRFILELYAEGLIDGVRIDHVDGLANPGAYTRKLRRAMAAMTSRRPAEAAQGEPYIVVEKILGADETLEPKWRTDGTTGYDFMNEVGALLHDPEGAGPLTAAWARQTGRPGIFAVEEERARRQILRENLAAELNSLAGRLHGIAQGDPDTRDYTQEALRRGLEELLAHFPVYRIYASAAGGGPADIQQFDRALQEAERACRHSARPVLALLRRWLLAEAPRALPPGPARQERLRAMRAFQQLSAPTAAKSVEDTAFYRFGRLLSRNEVGANPEQFSLSPEAFHAAMARRAETLPGALLATATHDHKRGEDTRARLAVLSEIPEEWERETTRWMKLNAGLRSGAAPCPADELMLYQMIVAGWPLSLAIDDGAGLKAYAERVAAWQEKSLREAKLHTDWAAPDEAYEAAATTLLHACFDPDRPALKEMATFAARIAPAGAVNGLAQTVLRLTVPGVPDLYQGTEFWDQSFVDPDNRRAVDFAARAAALACPETGVTGWRTGAVKQTVIARLLAARRALPALFAAGGYTPLRAQGPQAAHVLAFRRDHEGQSLVAAVTRLAGRQGLREPLLPASFWRGTALEIGAGPWRDRLTGQDVQKNGVIPLETLFSTLPVAVLARPESG
ncbi:malto-oligosyltrehalose synthase [Acidocella sp.]|uniref:malto-oligosyltrehalose synthase n=1 Tax=Acidocella sp. TaxID=50710 RepID=UPI002634619B|nr:malto-oligosyltrehalose synthase [Acidocella sp.]